MLSRRKVVEFISTAMASVAGVALGGALHKVKIPKTDSRKGGTIESGKQRFGGTVESRRPWWKFCDALCGSAPNQSGRDHHGQSP